MALRPNYPSQRVAGAGSLAAETWWLRQVVWRRNEHGEPVSTPGEAQPVTVRTLPGREQTMYVESSPGLRVRGRRKFWLAGAIKQDLIFLLGDGGGVQLYGGSPRGWWRVEQWGDYGAWLELMATWMDDQAEAPY